MRYVWQFVILMTDRWRIKCCITIIFINQFKWSTLQCSASEVVKSKRATNFPLSNSCTLYHWPAGGHGADSTGDYCFPDDVASIVAAAQTMNGRQWHNADIVIHLDTQLMTCISAAHGNLLTTQPHVHRSSMMLPWLVLMECSKYRYINIYVPYS